MRTIKFRGKSVDTCEWVYGNLINVLDPRKVKNVVKSCFISTPLGVLSETTKVDPDTVGQFTGLTDTNGVEVYEGDIIDIHQTVNGCNLFEVVWNELGWTARYAVDMVNPRLYEYDIRELFELDYKSKFPYVIEFEVIGTIHDKEVENES